MAGKGEVIHRKPASHGGLTHSGGFWAFWNGLSHTVWWLQSLPAFFCSFDSSLPCLESISEDKHGQNHESRQPAQSAAPWGYPAEPQEEKVNLGGPDVSLSSSLLLQSCLKQDWERFLSREASLSGKWAMNNKKKTTTTTTKRIQMQRQGPFQDAVAFI